jgi:hypothetical protein
VAYLALDRRRQTLADTDPPKEPDTDAAELAKEERARERLLNVAVAIVQLLAAQPGLSARRLRAAVRAKLGRASDSDVDAAVELLGAGVVRKQGRRGAYHYALDVSHVPPAVLARTGPLGDTAARQRRRRKDGKTAEGSS